MLGNTWNKWSNNIDSPRKDSRVLKNFTKEMEFELFEKARIIDGENIKNAIAGNPTVHNPYRETLILQVFQSVYYMIKQVRPRSYNSNRDEYIGEGMLAIVESYTTFDHTRGFRWNTYACNVLWKRFIRWDSKNKLVKKFDGEVVALTSGVKFSPQLVHHDTIDLDPKIDKDSLEDCCECLSEREKEVFLRRVYGDTLQVIADSQGVTKERIRQIELKAKEKVTRVLRERWPSYEFN